MFSEPLTHEPPAERPLAVARATVFTPIGGPGVVEQAVRRLGEAIGLGLLEVGERLPSEPDLATAFEIAPMTLRQALAILREAGHVETRRGRGGGTFVRRAAVPTPPAAVRRRLRGLSVEHLRDLTDFRVAVSGTGAALAAERASQHELDALSALIEEMASGGTFRRFRRADSRFHLTIASAASSPRLAAAEAALQGEIADLMALIPHPPLALRVSNAQHQAILDALAGNDPNAARALTESHVRGTGDFLVGLRLGRVG